MGKLSIKKKERHSNAQIRGIHFVSNSSYEFSPKNEHSYSLQFFTQSVFHIQWFDVVFCLIWYHAVAQIRTSSIFSWSRIDGTTHPILIRKNTPRLHPIES